jgi:CRISPR-associated protein Csx1
MSQTTIVQILGVYIKYFDVNYKLRNEGKIIRSKFSSVAYGKLKQKKIKILFFLPESILVKNQATATMLKNSPEKLIEKHQENLKEILGDDIPFELKIIPSIGSYNSKNEDEKSNLIINFNNFNENIIIHLLTELIEIEGELIIDISTGFNIYIHSLIEAVRSLFVYKKLRTILQKKNAFKVKCMIIPPVVGGSTDKILPIEIYDYKAKAFFDFPYQELNINNNFISFSEIDPSTPNLKTICKNSPKLGRISKEIIFTTHLLFNAIKYNIPLVLFSNKLISYEFNKENINKELKRIRKIPGFIRESTKIERINDKISLHRLKCLKPKIVNFLFTLGLYQSFLKFYEKNIISLTPTLTNIRNIFQGLYEKLGLGSNLRFLERDLKNIEKFKSKIKKNEAISLHQLERNEIEYKSDKTPPFSDKKRNFFAHSGLLKNFIKLEKNKDDEIEISYIDGNLEEIKNWLLKPET